MSAIRFIPIRSVEPEMFWSEIAQWPLSTELPPGATTDALLDLWIDVARRLQERERDAVGGESHLHKRSRE